MNWSKIMQRRRPNLNVIFIHFSQKCNLGNVCRNIQILNSSFSMSFLCIFRWLWGRSKFNFFQNLIVLQQPFIEGKFEPSPEFDDELNLCDNATVDAIIGFNDSMRTEYVFRGMWFWKSSAIFDSSLEDTSLLYPWTRLYEPTLKNNSIPNNYSWSSSR